MTTAPADTGTPTPGPADVADTNGHAAQPDRLEVTYYPVTDLRLFHRNAHIGNVDRIAASLQTNGQYKPVVVNLGTHTGRPLEVLAGNHTLLAAQGIELTELAAVTVDVTDEQCTRINLVDNPRPDNPDDLAYDERLLLELLGELPNLDGTGYEPGDIDDLEAVLQESNRDPLSDHQRRTPGINDLREGYETTGVRSVVLAYEGDQYVWVVDKLADLGDRFDLASNADIVARLIADAVA